MASLTTAARRAHGCVRLAHGRDRTGFPPGLCREQPRIQRKVEHGRRGIAQAVAPLALQPQRRLNCARIGLRSLARYRLAAARRVELHAECAAGANRHLVRQKDGAPDKGALLCCAGSGRESERHQPGHAQVTACHVCAMCCGSHACAAALLKPGESGQFPTQLRYTPGRGPAHTGAMHPARRDFRQTFDWYRRFPCACQLPCFD